MDSRTHSGCGGPAVGDCGRSCCGAWAPASYTRSFSLRAATWNRSSPGERRRRGVGTGPRPHPSALVSCSPAPEPGCPPGLLVKLLRQVPHLSLELLADGGVLADVTVQADRS